MKCTISANNLKVFARAVLALSKLPGEELYVEATETGLFLQTVNQSRTGYACFYCRPSFFVSFAVDPVACQNSASTAESAATDYTSANKCKITMKSVLTVFKSVATVETGELSIDADRSVLTVRFQYSYGIRRTYDISLLECGEYIQNRFDKSSCRNVFVCLACVVLDSVDKAFHPNQEEVTLCLKNSNEVSFKNYVDNEPEPDKVPKIELRLNAADLVESNLQQDAEITFVLKEFRALLSFVEQYQSPVSFYFDIQGKPVIFSVESSPSFSVEFVLATLAVGPIQTTAAEDALSRTVSSVEQRRGDSRDTMRFITPDSRSKVNLADCTPTAGGLHCTARNPLDHSAVSISAEDTLTDMYLNGAHSAKDAVSDVTAAEPQPKKKRNFLFENWSQDTMMESQRDNRSRVLAPDSDLEDY